MWHYESRVGGGRFWGTIGGMAGHGKYFGKFGIYYCYVSNCLMKAKVRFIQFLIILC